MNNSNSIQRRLEAQALEVPGLAGYPQIKPLIKWASDALAGLYAEVEAARADMYQTLVDRIFPEPEGRAFPAHALAQGQPSEPELELTTDWCGLVDKTLVYVSPIYSLRLFDASVVFQANFDRIEACEKDRKTIVATLSEPLLSHCLYIGLDIDQDIRQLAGLTIFFEGLPETKIPLIPLIGFYCAGKPIKTAMGLPPQTDLRPPFPDAEYLRLERIRRKITSEYEPQLLHMEDFEVPEQDTCPPALSMYLPQQPEENKKICWLELHLPDGFLPEDLAALHVRTNCFPVWNAQMKRQRGSFRDSKAIIPLADDTEKYPNHFLGIQHVWSDQYTFGPSELALPNLPTYGLQSGYLGQFNQHELIRRIDALLQLMETHDLDDFAAYTAENAYDIGCENVAEILEQLNENITGLKKQMAQVPVKVKQVHYYLHLQGISIEELVYYDYFVTQGGLTANQLWPYELKVIPQEQLTSVSSTTIQILGKIAPGRDALALAEREALIREKLSQSVHL